MTAAKKMVAFDCAIDMLAGPTEIVVTSESGDAVGIAADLVAQAEHDPEALAILITTNAPLAREVVREVAQRVKTNSVAGRRSSGMVWRWSRVLWTRPTRLPTGWPPSI